MNSNPTANPTMKKTLFLLLLALAACNTPYEIDPPGGDTTTALYVYDVNPEFPGGEEALQQYLSDNLIYPSECQVEGRVYIQFVVEKDGTLTNIENKRDIGGGCGQEAERLVRAMPPWKPGMDKGDTVRCLYTLSILFSRNQ